MVHLTGVLRRLGTDLQAKGYTCELSDPYPKWKPAAPGRDLSVGSQEGAQLTVVVKGTARANQAALVVEDCNRFIAVGKFDSQEEVDKKLYELVSILIHELKDPDPP